MQEMKKELEAVNIEVSSAIKAWNLGSKWE